MFSCQETNTRIKEAVDVRLIPVLPLREIIFSRIVSEMKPTCLACFTSFKTDKHLVLDDKERCEFLI